MTTLPTVHELERTKLERLEEEAAPRPSRRRGWLVRRALLAADIAGLFAAFLVTEITLSDGHVSGDELGRTDEYALFFFALPLWVVAAKVYGLYDRDEERTNHSTADDVAGVFQLMTITVWLVRVAAYVLGVGRPNFPKLLLFWALSIAFVALARAAGRAFCRRQLAYIQNTVIVGSGSLGQAVASRIMRHPEYGLDVVGFVSTRGEESGPLGHIAVIGELDQLFGLVERYDVERVIVACDAQDDPDLIRRLNDAGIQVDIVPRFHEVISGAIDIHTVEGIPVIGVPPFNLSRSSAFIKRWMDILGATIGLVILGPFMLVVAAAIRLDSRGPIFFRQIRVGADGKPFRIVKFRTMYADAEVRKLEVAHLSKHVEGGARTMFKIDNDPRVTRVGKLLRRTPFDELPQLWNVLRGEMSLVGPRPLILEEHAQVRGWEAKRLGLRPGITGVWQVLGRDEIPFEEMVRLDYLYVTQWSPGRDVRLVLQTLPIVFGLRPTY